MNVGKQAPLEAAPETVLESRKVLGMAIRGDHQLLVRLVQRIECVEELLEDLFLPIEELNVVEQQDIDGAVSRFELIHSLAANPVDEFVEKLL